MPADEKLLHLSPGQPCHSLNLYLRRQFGEKVVRVPVNLHQVCPNRDDGNPGCIFCLPESYEPSAELTAGSVAEQLVRGIERLGSFYRAKKFIAYFQSGSNTAGPADQLEQAYRDALAFEHVVGISISTRPDCFSPEILRVIQTLAESHTVWVELGVQSAHDRTLSLLNRGHDTACSAEAIRVLLDAGVEHIVAHMILGLPGETEEQMHDSFRFFADCGVHAFKIHHLQVIRNTPLEQMHARGEVSVFQLDDYARLVVDILERVNPGIVIHRLFGSVPERYLRAPVWPGRKTEHLQRILKEFRDRATWQGKGLET
jgi:radical SAM protein (TIGR01212 family)